MTDASYDAMFKGTWWLTTPHDIVWQRTGTSESRLILPFQPAPSMCCTICFDSQIDRALPPQLAAKGVTQEEWDGIMAELAALQRGTVGACVLFPMCLTCVLIPMVCMIGKRYQTGLLQWLERLNSAHLQPRGMLAKFQTATLEHSATATFAGSDMTHSTTHSTTDTSSTRWLAVALTPDESAQLAEESAFWRSAESIGRQRHWVPTPNDYTDCHCSDTPRTV